MQKRKLRKNEALSPSLPVLSLPGVFLPEIACLSTSRKIGGLRIQIGLQRLQDARGVMVARVTPRECLHPVLKIICFTDHLEHVSCGIALRV